MQNNYDQCEIEAKKYNNRKDFRAKSPIAYDIAKSENWLDSFFKNPKSVVNGWWQNKEHCLEAALHYKKRTEFAQGNKGAFLTAYRNGWLDEICRHMDDYQKENGTYKHKSGYWTKERCIEAAKKCANNGESKQMFVKKYSTAHREILKNNWENEVFIVFPILGNLYKRCIYAYEFSDNFVYVGLTCNMYKRNRDHHYKKDSAVYTHIQESGLQPQLKVISDFMNIEKAQEKEEETLKKYINKGWNILNRVKTGALGHGFPIWSKDLCRKIASQYITLKSFSDSEPMCYGAMQRQGWTKELCSHMKRRKVSLSEMKTAVVKYDTILDFRRGDYKIYSAAQRQGLLDQITIGMDLGRNGPSEEEIRSVASQYESYSNFINKNKTYCKWAKRIGIYDEITAHMRRAIRKEITFDICEKVAQKCKTRAEFKKVDASAYGKAIENGWLEEICTHMKVTHRTYTHKLLLEIASKYKTKKDFQKEDSAAYSYAFVHGLLDEICINMVNQKRKPYTLDECIEVAKKYKTRVEFQRKNNKVYLATQRNGWLDIVCLHMKTTLRKITKDMCLNIAQRCTTITEFRKMDGPCYNAAKRNGWLEEICEQMLPIRK